MNDTHFFDLSLKLSFYYYEVKERKRKNNAYYLTLEEEERRVEALRRPERRFSDEALSLLSWYFRSFAILRF